MVSERLEMGEEAFLQQCEGKSVQKLISEVQNLGSECCTTGLLCSDIVLSTLFRDLI